MKIKWSKLCKILRTMLGHCKHPTTIIMMTIMILYAGFILVSVHHKVLCCPDLSFCVYNDFSQLKTASAFTQWNICIRTTYIIKIQVLKSCPGPQDKNSLVTLFHAEISKPLVLDHKDCNHHFANEQMRPKYRICLRK